MTDCPTVEDLARSMDGALSVEQTERLEKHVRDCARCRDDAAGLRALIGDLKAPLPGKVDAAAYAREVMARIERPQAEPRRPSRWLFGAAAAAALVVALGVNHVRRGLSEETWQSRGGPVERTLSRDVSLRPCVVNDGLRFLSPGATIDPHPSITATFRNLGRSPAYLLLFAVDTAHRVHWIAPRFERAGEDPLAESLPSTAHETVLDTTAVLDDLSPGPLRIIAVVLDAPAHVSEIESMEGTEIDRARIVQRFSSGADVRETLVQVASGLNGGGR